MKRLWIGAGIAVAAATATTLVVASAADIGPLATAQLTSTNTTVVPLFAVRDSFTAANGTVINGRALELDPTGTLASFGTANTPTWTADASWVITGNAAESTGAGTKVAHFPFTAQAGYIATQFTGYPNNAEVGLALCYDPATTSGIVAKIYRARSKWYLAIGAMSAGVFTESSRAELPISPPSGPESFETRLRLQGGNAIASWGGVDYVSMPATSATGAAMVSFSKLAAPFGYVLAAKTG